MVTLISKGDTLMGFSKKFKKALKAEKRTIKDVAAELGKSTQTIYNTIHTDGNETPSGRVIGISYSTVEQMLDVIGYEIVFRRKSDGYIID